MKNLIYFLSFAVLTACSPFTNVSRSTEFSTEEAYIKITHPAVKFKTLTFGDFKFATTKKQYRLLTKKAAACTDILFYAITQDPAYEYYVLLNPKNKHFDTQKFAIKDTIINRNRIVLLITKTAPQSDITFISEHISSE